MGKCGCGAGTGCACVFAAGPGIKISGSGAINNPFRFTADIPDFSSAFVVNDSPTVDLELVGAGTPIDPLSLTAIARVSMSDLVDVRDATAPSVGDVPVWVSDATGAGWRFQPPPTVAPGQVNVGSNGGISGDGSGTNPLRVATSGIWGVNVGVAGSPSTAGQAIYVDTNGQLRAAPVAPPTNVDWGSLSGKPTLFASRWDLVQQKPATFPTTWAAVAGKPAVALAGHDHDDRYYTAAEGDGRYALIPPGPAWPSPSGPRAVLDVTGANKMGLRWSGAFPLVRVDNSEFRLAMESDLSGFNTRLDDTWALASGKANTFGDANTVRHSRGPDGVAYGRGMQGAGFFQVWMDNTLQFGRNTSSRQFKENIEPVDLGLETALALADQVVTFHRIDSLERQEVGVIAEEIEAIFPGAVTYWQDPDIEVVEEAAVEVQDGEVVPVIRQVERIVPGVSSNPLRVDGVRYDLLVLPALQAIKALHEQVQALTRKIEGDS